MKRKRPASKKPATRIAQSAKPRKVTQAVIASHFGHDKTYICRVITGKASSPVLRQRIVLFVASLLNSGFTANKKLLGHLFGGRSK